MAVSEVGIYRTPFTNNLSLRRATRSLEFCIYFLITGYKVIMRVFYAIDFDDRLKVGRHSNLFIYYLLTLYTCVSSLILNKYISRIVEKTVKITSGSLTLIRQHIALIDNFDVRFVEIGLVFLIF